ncbi:MAG: hypothetical protein HUK26_08315, partial [Duodenibacillus sp.]|nr:hypothetical protein [Duodenibacillus sp.]
AQDIAATIMPLSVSLQSSRFWIDPSSRGEHVVSAQLRFTSRIDAFDNPPVFVAPAGSGLEVGEPELFFNAARDTVTVTAKVKRLPAKPAAVTLRIPGVQRFDIKDGWLRTYAVDAQGNTDFSIGVDGAATLFKVTGVAIAPATDAKLDKAYELAVDTSLYTKPSELLAKLSVVELPRTMDPKATVAYNWAMAPTLPAAALNAGRKLAPVSLQSDDSPVSKLRFMIDPKPGSYVLVFVDPSLASATGLKASKPWRKIYRAGEQDASLALLQPGNVLPLAGDKKLDVYATDVDRVDWEVLQVRDPFLALVAQNSYSPMASPMSGAEVSIDVAGVLHKGSVPMKGSAPGKAVFSTIDLAPVLEGKAAPDARGLMLVRLKAMRGDEQVRSLERLVLATDLGMLVKKTPAGALDVFVRTLGGEAPAAGALVQVLGANGRPVAEAKADAQGLARIPSLKGLERDKKPVAAVARAGADMAWIPLEDAELAVSMASLPTAGRSVSSDGLMALVFGQRGVFRPGEKLQFGMLARRADWRALPAELPLKARLYGPSGAKLAEKVVACGAEGLADFAYELPASAASGRYQLDVALPEGEVIGTASARVEEFQPDTLAISGKLSPAPAAGWLRVAPGAGDAAVEVALATLNGLAAAGNKVKATASLAPATLRFAGYEEYSFHNASPLAAVPPAKALGEAQTGADG